MNKLLYAGFSRLFKSNVFRITIIAAIIISSLIVLSNYPQNENAPEYVSDIFFNFYQLIGIFSAVGISLTLGTEYSDGTIRNKLIIGHNRKSVYFSYLITNMVFMLIILAIHIIMTCSLGYFLLGLGNISLVKICCALLSSMVYAAFFTAISTNCPNKAVNAVVCIIIALLMIVVANYAYNQLLEPEMTYDGITITQDGIEYGNYIKNPAYVSGTFRMVLEIFLDIIPSGQLILIQSGECQHITLYPIYSVLILALITFTGCKIFYKRNIS